MNLIFTIAAKTHVRPYFNLGVESIRAYAHKTQTDFLIKYNSDLALPACDKFFIPELLKVYNRVLWIDSDILIKEDADNLFEKYPDTSKFYIHDECERAKVNYEKYISYVSNHNNIEWPRNEYNKYIQYNGGVFLISRGPQEEVFAENEIKTEGLPYLIDQTLMNYNINLYNIPIGNLDIKYNAMKYFNEDGFFIHYANVSNRYEIMKGDL